MRNTNDFGNAIFTIPNVLDGLSLTYNSLAAPNGPGANPIAAPGCFGWGWTLMSPWRFFASLSAVGNTGPPVANESIQLNNGLGSFDIWTWDSSSSSYLPMFPNTYDVLTTSGSDFIVTLKDQTQLKFTSSGQLYQQVDSCGNPVNYAYYASGSWTGYLESVTDQQGRGYFFTAYGASGQPTSIYSKSSTTGRLLQLSYTSAGLLSTVTLANGLQYGLAYWPYNTTTNAYYLESVTTPQPAKPSGVNPNPTQRVNFTYNTSGQVTQELQFYVLSATGFATTYQVSYTYGYTGTSMTVAEQDGVTLAARTKIRTFDQLQRLIQNTDSLGNVSEYGYTANDPFLLTSQTNSNLSTTSFSWDDNGNLTGVTDAQNGLTQLIYGAPTGTLANLVVQVISPSIVVNGVTTNYIRTIAYDSWRNPLQTQDELGNVTQFKVNQNGGTTASGTNGWITSLTDANANQVNVSYTVNNTSGTPDPALPNGGNVASVTVEGPTGPLTTSQCFDLYDNAISVTAPNGATSRVVRDALDRPVLAVNALGRQWAWVRPYQLLTQLIGPANAASAANPIVSTTVQGTGFTQPAVQGITAGPVTFANTSGMVVGQLLSIAEGGYYTVSSIVDGTHAYLLNLGYAENASPGAGIPANASVNSSNSRSTYLTRDVAGRVIQALQPTDSSGLTDAALKFALAFNGFGTLAGLTRPVAGSSYAASYDLLDRPVSSQTSRQSAVSAAVAGSGFAQPASGSTVAVTFTSTAAMASGQVIYVAGGGYYSVSSVSSGTAASIENLGYAGNASSGTAIAAGSAVMLALVSTAVGSAGFTQPAVGATASVPLASSVALAVGQLVYVHTGGVYGVSSIPDGTHAVLTNLGSSGNVAAGSSIASGSAAVVAPASGVTTAVFTQPAVGSSVTVTFQSTSQMAAGQSLFLSSGLQTSVPTAISTTVGSGFTQPAVGSSQTVTFANTSGMVPGQMLFVATGGLYQISSLISGTQAVLTNLGASGNAAPSTPIASGSQVSPCGTGGLYSVASITSSTQAMLTNVGNATNSLSGAVVAVGALACNPWNSSTDTAYSRTCFMSTVNTATGILRATRLDSLCRLTQISTQAELKQLAYDTLSRLSSVTSGSVFASSGLPNQAVFGPAQFAQTRLYNWDPGSRLQSVVQPNGKSVWYARDRVGNIVQQGDTNGNVITRRFFPNYQLASLTYSNPSESPQTFTFGYSTGQLTTINYPAPILATFGFDKARRPASLQYTNASTGANILSFVYGYDDSGNKVSIVEQNGVLFNTTVGGSGFSQPAVGANTASVAFASTIGMSAGQLIWVAGGGLYSVVSISGSTAVLTNIGAPCNALAGHVIASGATATSQLSYAFGYDWFDRLTSVSLNGSTISTYALDPNDNRLQCVVYRVDGSSSLQGSVYNVADELQATASSNTALESFVWDGDGRMTTRTLASSGQVTGYTWSTFDKLGMAAVNGTVQEMDGYSADGLRNVKSDGTNYVNSGSLPLCETRSTGPVSFIRAGSILGIDPGGTGAPYFYLTDHLGSVRQIVNASGTTESTSMFAEFGAITPVFTATGSGSYSDRSLGFVGALGVRNEPGTPANQPSGSNNGLVLMGQRWYDPQLGRFLSRDPIGFKGGLNLYGYVGANPTNFVDPSGLIAGWANLAPNPDALKKALDILGLDTNTRTTCNAIRSSTKDPLGFRVEFGHSTGGEWGETTRGMILIDDRLSPEQQALTLFHEYLHYLQNTNPGGCPEKNQAKWHQWIYRQEFALYARLLKAGKLHPNTWGPYRYGTVDQQNYSQGLSIINQYGINSIQFANFVAAHYDAR